MTKLQRSLCAATCWSTTSSLSGSRPSTRRYAAITSSRVSGWSIFWLVGMSGMRRRIPQGLRRGPFPGHERQIDQRLVPICRKPARFLAAALDIDDKAAIAELVDKGEIRLDRQAGCAVQHLGRQL